MSKLFYSNLPDIGLRPDIVNQLARNGLGDFERYLGLARKRMLEDAAVAHWSIYGEYYRVNSEGGGNKKLSKILSREGSFELRAITAKGNEEKIPNIHLYASERIIVLDQRINTSQCILRSFDNHDESEILNLSLSRIENEEIGGDIKLPSYWVKIQIIDDIEHGNQRLKKFFEEEQKYIHQYTGDKGGDLTPNQLVRAKSWEIRNIRIKDRDRPRSAIRLQTLPLRKGQIFTKPNTYTIDRQIDAIKILKEKPDSCHRPLIRLFENIDKTSWPALSARPTVTEFKVLEDGFSGVEEQREFVLTALSTPDFALLEGPPGSGKTAVITEIILQSINRGDRVLLCASTHVAVDNVIERLKKTEAPFKDEVQLVRVGDEDRVSSFARDYCISNRVGTEVKELMRGFRSKKKLLPWQRTLFDSINRSKEKSKSIVRRIILDSAQVVCGTTMGILQLPEIKERMYSSGSVVPKFDMLILDEASKTTFSEFVVPAIHAKKWIIVGDCRQLSPYVDINEIEANVAGSFDRAIHQGQSSRGGKTWRKRCLQLYDAFDNAKHASTIIEVSDDGDRHLVMKQARHVASILGHSEDLIFDLSSAVPVRLSYKRRKSDPTRFTGPIDPHVHPKRVREVAGRTARRANKKTYYKPKNIFGSFSSSEKGFSDSPIREYLSDDPWSLDSETRLRLITAPIVVGTLAELILHERFLPNHCNPQTVGLDIANARSRAAIDSRNIRLQKSWEDAVRWRYTKDYESRLLGDKSRGGHALPSSILPLTPCAELLMELRDVRSPTTPESFLNTVFRVAFPSMLECLQFGFGRGGKTEKNWKSAITEGLPASALEERHVALRFQHRMHPDISKFPRDSIYDSELLLDAEGIEEDLAGFSSGPRCVWIDVPDGRESRSRSKFNRREVEVVIDTVQDLNRRLKNTPNPEERPWKVAILSFYRGQDRELRNRLDSICKGTYPRYKLGCLEIEAGVVDSFQGREADIVILSYVRTGSPGFLDSVNRLNVAITRARYQMYHVGNMRFWRKDYARKKAPLIDGIIQSLPREAKQVAIGKGKRWRD